MKAYYGNEQTMNIITFDIEEWYIESVGSKRAEKYAEYDQYLDAILSKLERRNIKATFFCVGEMGRLYPEVIRKIHAHGHEIGCHSNIHTWLNKMSEAECREDTRRCVGSLEQCIGEKVKSYRAPAFSIGESNKWAFEILSENGIERDASVFPASRDFGGFPGFGQKMPCLIAYHGIQIKEFPVCTTNVLGKDLAYSGGGYFRFFPLGFVKRTMKNSPYAMCYFHIGDLVPESEGVLSKKAYEAYFKEPGTIKARYMRYYKTNFGKKNAFNKLEHLINNMDFSNLSQADECLNWDSLFVVRL